MISKEEKDSQFFDLTLFLYSINSLPKNTAGEIISRVQRLFSNAHTPNISGEIDQAAENYEVDPRFLGEVKLILELNGEPLVDLDTEKND